jgi:hypothetical protein
MGKKKHPGDVVDSSFKDLIWGVVFDQIKRLA